MNENQITPEVEEVESQIEGAETETDADEDGWPTEWAEAVEEDDGNEGETDEVTTEADQPTEEPESDENENAEKPAETKPEQKTEDTDQYLELKHLDEVRKVSREEAKTLAQKGLDYDRIRGERDAMQKDYQQLKKYESFLNELKGDFPSIDAMMTDTRARMLAEKEGISYSDAVAKVGVMGQQAPAKQTQQPQNDGQIDFTPFIEKYPGLKADEIPQSVWDEVKRTGDMLGAYENYQNTNALLTAVRDGVQSIKDELCNDRLDAERRDNANLRAELMYARGQASQVAQTAELRQSGANQLNQLVSELRSCPIPAQPVYGNTPIWTCAQNVANSTTGCGCNGNGFVG